MTRMELAKELSIVFRLINVPSFLLYYVAQSLIRQQEILNMTIAEPKETLR